MMRDQLNVDHRASVTLVRGQPKDRLDCHGRVHVEHWRAGKLLAEFDVDNYITNQGRQYLLNLMFSTGASGVTASAIALWYMGLVDSSGFSAFAQGDVYTGIAATGGSPGNGWSEFVSYTDDLGGGGATRPSWGAGASSVTSNVAQVTNATTAVFDITAAGTIVGLFIVGGGSGTNAKTQGNNTTGSTLWSAAAFTAGNVTVQNGDQLKVTYTVTA
jgi:hypothetical protein